MKQTKETAAILEIKQQFEAEMLNVRQKFTDMFKPLLSKYIPEGVEYVKFTQYTPYFNDGEECTFRVNCNYLDVKYINNEDEVEVCGYRSETDDNMKTLIMLLNNIPDDIMKALYGDHVQVTLYKDGSYETDEYDHE